MNKKVISMAALLAIMAFAMVPTAAQALEGKEGNKSPVHWQLNGTKTAVGTVIPMISWGTAKLESALGTIQCRNAAAGNNTNLEEAGKLKAKSEVVMFATYECQSLAGECNPPAEERVTGFNLTPDSSPNKGVWPSITVEEGPANAEEKFRSYDLSGAGGENPIEVNIECFAGGENIGSLLFVSGPVGGKECSSTPLVINGSSATKPSETSFEDPLKETGHLCLEAPTELVKEETVEPTVKNVSAPGVAPAVIKDEGKNWAAIIKPGCRVKSEALFPNEIVASNTTTEATLENKLNPTKNFILKAGTFPTKFNCGALTVVPIESTTKGQFKFVGYLDKGTTPLINIGSSLGK